MSQAKLFQKDLEAGLPIDPVAVVNAGLSLLDIILAALANRKMLKQRMTILEAALTSLAADNKRQQEQLDTLQKSVEQLAQRVKELESRD